MYLWDVYLKGKKIDTITTSRVNGTVNEQSEEIRKGLVEHDGYDPGIVVRRRRN